MEEIRKRRGPSDATDYSSTQAPETQKHAEGRRPHPGDERLVPGGPQGTPDDPGIGSLDPESATDARRAIDADPAHRDRKG